MEAIEVVIDFTKVNEWSEKVINLLKTVDQCAKELGCLGIQLDIDTKGELPEGLIVC